MNMKFWDNEETLKTISFSIENKKSENDNKKGVFSPVSFRIFGIYELSYGSRGCNRLIEKEEE